MATTNANNWADLLIAELGSKAKAYRLAQVNSRLTAQTTGGSDDRLKNTKTKIEADNASGTWTFTKEDVASSDDLVIKATAPSSLGGHTRIWGYVEGTSGSTEGNVRVKLTDGYVATNSIDDTNRAAFFSKISHIDGKQF